jgi:hydroxyethylthiazole kinase-like sugar kinase family protein
MLTAMIAAYLSQTPTIHWKQTAAAVCAMGVCGERRISG